MNRGFRWSSQNLWSRLYRTLGQSENSLLLRIAGVTALSGLALRFVVLFLSGNRQVGPFSGVGDQIRYSTLADSINEGRGFTYAGQPTALRPPLYPLLLAASHSVFGSNYLLAVRIFQFLIGIAVAYLCFLVADGLFGIVAGAMAAAIALSLPTLVFISVELQTEQLAAFLTLLFLRSLLGETQRKKNAALGMGVTSGLVSLVRFNGAILPIVGAFICLWSRRSLRHAVVVCIVAGLLLFPWIVRNAEVFHGSVFFSTHGGINLLEGVLTPDGRAQNGEGELIRQKIGWLHTDIEVNSPHRLLFPDEDQLDKQARIAAIAAWQDLDWKSVFRLLSRKVFNFWLSTDQLFGTKSFSPTQRKLRVAGVVVYWIVLVLAIVGWIQLFFSSRDLAITILCYAVIVTAAHLPFVMNTRLRIPFFDPLLTILAAGGFLAVCAPQIKIRMSRFQSGDCPAEAS